MRALPTLLVLALVIAGAVFIADRPGSVALVWQGWRVDTSVTVLLPTATESVWAMRML